MNDLALRIRANLGQKLLLSAALTVSVWGGYLLIQRFPFRPVTVVQPSRLDRLIPFMPGAVYLYESIWLLMPVAPWLMTSADELKRYTRGLVAICLAGFTVFLLFPTSLPRPKCPPDVNLLYATLVHVDSELNALPSLHSAFAVFHGLCCQAVFSSGRWSGRIRCLVWIWVLGIIISTFLTKQHVLLDAAAGALLGVACHCLFSRRAGNPRHAPHTHEYIRRRNRS
jgi:membrane-associated phospholipid phosphatase